MTQFRFEWVETYLKRAPNVIFDVGCWDAGDSIAFKERFPMASVFAFEACPDNFADIERAGKAAAAGVSVHHFAVCEHDRGVRFFSNSTPNHAHGCSGSLLRPTRKLKADAPQLSFKEGRDVPSTRLDEFCKARGIAAIDVLHMDVQGAEAMVLEGLGEMRPKLVFLETDETGDTGHYEGSPSLGKLLASIWRRGYDLKWDSGHDALWVYGK